MMRVLEAQYARWEATTAQKLILRLLINSIRHSNKIETQGEHLLHLTLQSIEESKIMMSTRKFNPQGNQLLSRAGQLDPPSHLVFWADMQIMTN